MTSSLEQPGTGAPEPRLRSSLCKARKHGEKLQRRTASPVQVLAAVSRSHIGGTSEVFNLRDGHDWALVERLAANRYLAFAGSARAPMQSTAAASFEGWVYYCVLNSEAGSFQDCGQNPHERVL